MTWTEKNLFIVQPFDDTAKVGANRTQGNEFSRPKLQDNRRPPLELEEVCLAEGDVGQFEGHFTACPVTVVGGEKPQNRPSTHPGKD